MFLNDPNSPAYTVPRQQRRTERSNQAYLGDAGYSIAEFAARHGTNPEVLKLSTYSAGSMFGRPFAGAKSAYEYGLKGSTLFSIPYAAYSMANAPKGRAIGNAIGAFSGMTFGGAIGGLLGGPIGAMVGSAVLSGPIERGVSSVVNTIAQLHNTNNRVHAGGDYKDTQRAYTMRQRAAQEMSGSLFNARQYLGSEATMFHG